MVDDVVASPDVPTITTIINGEQFALVALERGTLAQVPVTERQELRFQEWRWASVRDNGKVKLSFNYPITGVVQAGQAIDLGHLMSVWLSPTDERGVWLGLIEQLLTEPLIAAWTWNGARPKPAIVAEFPDEGTPNFRDALRYWRARVVPDAARILQGLYCPDGYWEDVTRSRPPSGFYNARWAGAAAREARAWLRFYASEGCWPADRHHLANAYQFSRIYALALIGRALDPSQLSWSTHWPDDLAEAIEHWLEICFDDRAGWFFDAQWWTDPPPPSYFHRLSARYWRREEEVNRLCNALRCLLKVPASDAHSQPLRETVCQQLTMLQVEWYLPHYELGAAWIIERALIRERGERVSLFRWATFGVARLYAAIGIGLVATTLQDDTWNLAAQLVTDRTVLAVLATLGMGAAAYAYLVWEIVRRVHIRATERAIPLFVRGQLAALFGTVVMTLIAAPFLLREQVWQRLPPLGWIGMIVLIAQLALFIGIFTHLLFGEKPATAPLGDL